MAIAPLTGAKKLRQLLSDPNHIVVAPGVFDGFTARLALASGFEAIYMVSSDLLWRKSSINQHARRPELGHQYLGLAGQI